MIHPTSQLIVQQLLDYLNASPTAYHATANACRLLEEKGFRPLDEGEAWSLEPEKGYYVQRNQSALLAFRLGNKVHNILQIKDLGLQPPTRTVPLPS